MNDRVPGVMLRDAPVVGLVTVKVAPIFSGELEAPEAVTVMVPL